MFIVAKPLISSSVPHCRTYATLQKISALHEKHDMGPWPSSKSPTPQQIFNLSNKDFELSQLEFSKLLKKQYNKYLKIYHPDIINNIEVHNEKNKLMTTEMKRARFDTIQKAYEVLKDPKRRLAYGRSVTTDWSQYSPNASSFESFRMANAHRKKYDFKTNEEFWRAGTWEDYYQMKYNRAPPTQEEFDKNKYKILGCVVAVMVISCTIQLLLAFEKANDAQYQAHLQSLRLMKEHEKAYYNEFNNRFSSIRDLLVRRRAGVRDQQALKEREIQDSEILTEYAKKQTQKYQQT